MILCFMSNMDGSNIVPYRIKIEIEQIEIEQVEPADE